MGAPQQAGPAFVDLTGGGGQFFASGPQNVFASGGNLYAVVNTIGSGGSNINGTGVVKSTDGGTTWALMDAANSPSSANGVAWQDGTTLIFGLVTDTFPQTQQTTFLQNFDMGTDTWGAAYATGGPLARTTVQFTFKRPDASIVIVYNLDATAPAGTSTLRAAAWDGAAWSSSIDIGVSLVALQANGLVNIGDTVAAMDSTGRIHVGFDNNNRTFFLFVQLDPSNAVVNAHQFTETFQPNLPPYGSMVIAGSNILISAMTNAGVNNTLLIGTALTSPVWTDVTPSALQPANLDKAGPIATDGANLIWMINFFDPVTFNDNFQLAKSTDNGATWQILSDNTTSPYFYDFTNSPLAPNTDPTFGISSATLAVLSPGGTPTAYGFVNVRNTSLGSSGYFMNSEAVGPAPSPAPTKLEISLFGVRRRYRAIPQGECLEVSPAPRIKRVL